MLHIHGIGNRTGFGLTMVLRQVQRPACEEVESSLDDPLPPAA